MGQKSQNFDDIIDGCPNGEVLAVWTRLGVPALPLAVASFPEESPARLVLEQAPVVLGGGNSMVSGYFYGHFSG